MKKVLECVFLLFMLIISTVHTSIGRGMSQIDIIAQSVRNDIKNQPDKKMLILDSNAIIRYEKNDAGEKIIKQSCGYIAFSDGNQIVIYLEGNLLNNNEINQLKKSNGCKITSITNPNLRYLDHKGVYKYGKVVLQAIRCHKDQGMINGHRMTDKDNLKFWIDYIKNVINYKQEDTN